jgi:hypothetical protein
MRSQRRAHDARGVLSPAPARNSRCARHHRRRGSVLRRNLERWLVRAEIAASETDRADRQRASHRQRLRADVEICARIGERLLLMGLDPALAVGLQAGEEAAAEPAAIPDSEALRRADDAITHGDVGDRTEVRSSFEAKIEPMVARFCEGLSRTSPMLRSPNCWRFASRSKGWLGVDRWRPSVKETDYMMVASCVRARERERVPRVPKLLPHQEETGYWTLTLGTSRIPRRGGKPGKHLVSATVGVEHWASDRFCERCRSPRRIRRVVGADDGPSNLNQI